MKHRGFLMAFALTLVSVGTGRADPTFIESRLYLRAEAQVYPDPLQWVVQSRYIVGGYYDQDASVSSASSTSNGTAIAQARAAMTWTSESKGRVTFDDVSFVQAILSPSGMADVNNSFWYYTFTTGDENELKIKYGVGIKQTTSPIVGIQGFSVQVTHNGGLVFGQDLDLDTNGTLVVPLEPYQTYTVWILPSGGFHEDSGLGISSMSGDFSWSLKYKAPKDPDHQHHVGRHGVGSP